MKKFKKKISKGLLMGSGFSKKKNDVKDDDNCENPDSSNKMHLFRRQSADSKKRQQHQEYLVVESPDNVVDLSNCEISEVPSGIYTQCQVYRKDVLLLHNNWLSSLTGGGMMTELSSLRVLDISYNEFTQIPSDIICLKCLQIFRAAHNKIKHIPSSLTQLKHLQTLNLEGNKLKSIPEDMFQMKSLRTFNVNQNSIDTLPKNLCKIRTLESLHVDTKKMIYPSSDVCSLGTESIMRFLCSELGFEYEPPSKHINLDIGCDVPDSPDDNNVNNDMSHIDNEILQYEKMKEKRHQDQIDLEKLLIHDQELEAKLLLDAHKFKDDLLQIISQDQKRFDSELNELQSESEAKHQRFVDIVCEEEKKSSQLVEQLLKHNETARKHEELLEQMEKERMIAEEWFKVRQEEIDCLRKKEVVIAMERIVRESEAYESLFNAYIKSRDDQCMNALESIENAEEDIEMLMQWKRNAENHFIEQLIREESLQKEAFTALQLQKDMRYRRLLDQTELIQNELSKLTRLEVKERKNRERHQMDVIDSRRQALVALLSQLMEAKDFRASELKKRLQEMEDQKQNDQSDYWLVQYQRLMDMKPQTLMNQEKNLEKAVVNILESADAEDYIAKFAFHRITIETLLQLTDEDLKQMGVHEKGVRMNLLQHIKFHIESQQAYQKKINITSEETCDNAEESIIDDLEPSAPTQQEQDVEKTNIIARGLNSECVICLDSEAKLLFLNCGHVCCCLQCGEPIISCPLCRSDVVLKVKLSAL